MNINRRRILKLLSTTPLLTVNDFSSQNVQNQKDKSIISGIPKISLNLYSFNDQLRAGEISLDDVLEYAFEQAYDAIDPTAYYFKGYPQVPEDEYLYNFKRKVFKKGLEISGTGVRNDFSNPDPDSRKQDIVRIEKWANASSKLGIPVLRIFAGHAVENPSDWKKTRSWMLEDFKRCAEIGERYGVIMALQNHGEYIRTASEVIEIIEEVNSAWFGLHLDIASFILHNIYEEIEKTVKYAVNWQIKEFVINNGEREEPDYSRILGMIRDHHYYGYLPLETLGEGDPFEKLKRLKEKVTSAINYNYQR